VATCAHRAAPQAARDGALGRDLRRPRLPGSSPLSVQRVTYWIDGPDPVGGRVSR